MLENKALVLDFLEWIATKPRPYADVMDAWRTSCPRLTIWEDTIDARFVALTRNAMNEPQVEITAVGEEFMTCERPPHG